MSAQARITVTTGPDRGKAFEVTGDLVRVGRGADNDFVLSDPQMADYQLSIVSRDGRFAVCAVAPDGIEIEGTAVPADQWVWLPDEASIKVTRRTSVQFVSLQTAPASASAGKSSTTQTVRSISDVSSPIKVKPAAAATGTDVPGSSDTVSGRRKNTGNKKTGNVARFITDGPGDPLVKLGEDGHLPELALVEGDARKARDAKSKETSPILLIIIFIVSMSLTVLMLFLEVSPFGSSAAEKAAARRELEEYYGEKNQELAPYQIHLRQARQAVSRGDVETERNEYRRVLDLLRSEVRSKSQRYTGLTGRLDYEPFSDDKKSDKRLEELIGILLKE
jgi:hypothetical protein